MNADRGKEELFTDETADQVPAIDIKQETNKSRSRETDGTSEQNGELPEFEDDLRWNGDRDEAWTQSSDPSSEDEDEEERVSSTSGYVLLPQDVDSTNGAERTCSSERGVNDRSSFSEKRVNDKSGTSEKRVNDMTSGVEELHVRTQHPRMTKWLQKQVNDMTVKSRTSTVSTTSTAVTNTSSTVVHTSTSNSALSSDGDWAKFNDPTPASDSHNWPTTSTLAATTTAVPVTTAECVVPSSTMREDEAAAIKHAMAGFSLPDAAMPSWAQAVPELVWKAELIGGLKKQPKKKNK